MKIFTPHNSFWPVLLALVAIFGYITTSTQMGWYQPVPFVSLALLGGAVVWSAGLVKSKRSILRIVALALTVLLAALFSWWTLSFSEYETQRAAVEDGETATRLVDMVLRDHAGIERPVLAQGGATLLVLHRGHW